MLTLIYLHRNFRNVFLFGCLSATVVLCSQATNLVRLGTKRKLITFKGSDYVPKAVCLIDGPI